MVFGHAGDEERPGLARRLVGGSAGPVARHPANGSGEASYRLGEDVLRRGAKCCHDDAIGGGSGTGPGEEDGQGGEGEGIRVVVMERYEGGDEAGE